MSQITNEWGVCGVFLSERPWQEGLLAPPPGPPQPVAPGPRARLGSGSAEMDTVFLDWESPWRRGETRVWGPGTNVDVELLSRWQRTTLFSVCGTWVEERASLFFFNILILDREGEGDLLFR